MRALWKGTLGFGLVIIPVRLYAATSRQRPSFNQLHRKCSSPIKYLKWCPVCREEVTADEIVLGYEYERGRFVLMQDEDFDGEDGTADKSILILDFVSLAEIDPVYFDKSYYLAPAEGGQRAYHLLLRVMDEAQKVAVCRVRIRARESLATVRVYRGGCLAMETMLYPAEVRDYTVLEGLSPIEPEAREIEMARMLVENLSVPFDPERYVDRTRERLLSAIERRIAGQHVVVPEQPEPARVIDLMEALKESVKRSEEGKREHGAV